MEPTLFWKNFRLGEELGISGAFIYNGLRRFHEMRSLDCSDEIFESLYDLSVGFERLLKITVVLLEHHDGIDQEELERSLITHSHLDLLVRVKNHVSINFGAPHNDFLSLLGTFYKSHRYNRFTLASAYNPEREIEALCEFLEKHLGVSITRGTSIFRTSNEDRYRQFVRKTTLKISRALFEVIKSKARSINLFTYELRSGSKAETVFLREVDISHEDVLWKELLVFFMNSDSTSGYLEFLRRIPPLDFDPELVGDYLDCFHSDAAKSFVMDELEQKYEDLGKGVGDRLAMIRVIGDPSVCFDSSEEEENPES